mgnify:CR=1 FL=1
MTLPTLNAAIRSVRAYGAFFALRSGALAFAIPNSRRKEQNDGVRNRLDRSDQERPPVGRIVRSPVVFAGSTQLFERDALPVFE